MNATTENQSAHIAAENFYKITMTIAVTLAILTGLIGGVWASAIESPFLVLSIAMMGSIVLPIVHVGFCNPHHRTRGYFIILTCWLLSFAITAGLRFSLIDRPEALRTAAFDAANNNAEEMAKEVFWKWRAVTQDKESGAALSWSGEKATVIMVARYGTTNGFSILAKSDGGDFFRVDGWVEIDPARAKLQSQPYRLSERDTIAMLIQANRPDLIEKLQLAMRSG